MPVSPVLVPLISAVAVLPLMTPVTDMLPAPVTVNLEGGSCPERSRSWSY